MRQFVASFAMLGLLGACDMAPKEKLGIDYHTHIQSPEMGTHMGVMCGKYAECDAEEMAKGTSVELLLPTLETSQFNRAVIMSVGYMGGMPDFGIEIEAEKSLTRHENQYIADQVATSEKLISFYSVNPLRDYAIEEAKYWQENDGHSGLKLHMANSDVDFFNADHVKKLQDLFDVVDEDGMTIFIHLRNRNSEYDGRDVEVFVNEILPHAPKSTIIIAHAVGWGGFDEPNEKALDYFIKAMADGRVDTARTYIGVGAVIMEGLTEDRKTLFLEKFRSLNIENWVFGSDWAPVLSPLDPVTYAKSLNDIGMTEEELSKLISNKLPFIK